MCNGNGTGKVMGKEYKLLKVTIKKSEFSMHRLIRVHRCIRVSEKQFAIEVLVVPFTIDNICFYPA